MRPLILDTASTSELRRVKAYARTRPFDTTGLEKLLREKIRIGDDRGFRCEVPVGFIVCYSIEQQPPPLGWCHHVSISVETPGKVPNLAAVALIALEFEIRGDISDCHLWNEPLPEGRQAVNLLASIPESPLLAEILERFGHFQHTE